MLKKLLSVILLAVMLATVFSCKGEDIIGTSENAFLGESVTGSAIDDSAVVTELSGIIYSLTIGSTALPEFGAPSEALSKCGDSLLNHLLTTNYSRFSGNTETLKKAAEKFPQLSIAAAIGKEDYEGALYKYFNHGGNIRHGDTERFRYLSKIGAYVPAVKEIANSFELDIISIDETENTYRMTFYCKENEQISAEYFALFVKRENKGCYIYSVEKKASEKVSYNIPDVFS